MTLETKTFLYRIENPNISSKPDGITSNEAIVGQWFTPDPARVVQYLKKSQKQPGAQLVVAELPVDELAAYHVTNHPIANNMDVELDNYMVPRDGSVPTRTVPLDELVGDLNPSNLAQRLEAGERIGRHLEELGLINPVSP